jgi:hypothetical protein
MNCRTSLTGSLALAFALAGCYRSPPEGQLIQSFTSHRSAIDKLLIMATADRTVYRIPAEGLAPRGMPESRFKEYLAVFRELGVRGGVDWGIPSHPDGLFVIASSSVPIGGGYRIVGYAYLSTPPPSLQDRLPDPWFPFEFHHSGGHRLDFRQLNRQWYLFYASEW